MRVKPGAPLALFFATMFFAGLASAAELPPLPQPVASFGAATLDHHLYVYGGHIGKTHVHSVDDQTGRFLRLDLDAPQAWEEIGSFEALQGLALVPWQGGVCRIGGMRAMNRRGDQDDLHSIADVLCWRPTTQTWTALPPLPAPRSSHDAVVHDGKIYVAGGWRLAGVGQKGVWAEDLLIYEPEKGAWRSVPQPFVRRALAVVVAGGKLWTLGGLDRTGMSRQVHSWDIARETWAEAAKMPYVGDLDGFGAAAVGVDDGILMSASDGIVQALPSGVEAWTDVGRRWQEHRFFHRMVTYKDQLFAIGGATPKGHTATLEAQSLPRLDQLAKAAAAVAPVAPVAQAGGEWPGFRGAGDGQLEVTPSAEAPAAEAVLAWRQPLPGYGQSSPVVWGAQTFLTSVVGPLKEELVLSALDLGTGEVRWRRRFAASLMLESKDTVSRAAPTPVVDGERLYAFWESGDLIAVDHQGETLWRRQLAQDYGVFEGNHGLASSPILAGGVLVLQITHGGPSYLLGIATATGETLWKHERPAKVAWTTPLFVPGDPALVVVSGNGDVEALDAQTGALRFQLLGLEKNVSASPVLAGDLLVAPSSEKSASVALRLSGRGALGEEAIVWRAQEASAGFASPVFAGGCLIFVGKTGVASCVDPASGASRWQERLGDEVWASPIAAGGRVFFFTKKGQRLVYDVSLEGARRLAGEELGTGDVVYGVAAAPGLFLVRTGNELLRLSSPTTRLAGPAGPASGAAMFPSILTRAISP